MSDDCVHDWVELWPNQYIPIAKGARCEECRWCHMRRQRLPKRAGNPWTQRRTEEP